jgi:predicted ATPase/DNA-binding SARP family transcriptional activator/predicted negative regulator of RcsB-dependent stress response
MILPTSTLWNIQLFGGLKVSASNGSITITRFRSQRYAALLSYLLLYPNRQHAREELADMLWPEAEAESARTNLRTALASLRRQLEGQTVSGSGDVIRAVGRTHLQIISEAVITDVGEFEKAINRTKQPGIHADDLEASLRQAIQLYQGPLLPGSYEPWALSERDRLGEAYQNTLLQLCDLRERAGDIRGACETAQQAVAADPLREEARALLIRQYRRLGDETAARRQFREIERLLDEHFGAEPSPLLKAALHAPLPVLPISTDTTSDKGVVRLNQQRNKSEKVNNGTTLVARSLVPNKLSTEIKPTQRVVQIPLLLSRFFGRETEIALLVKLLTADTTRLVTLTGTGGSGKTRLSIESVKQLPDDAFPGGIWFVSLAELRGVERIPEAIAQKIGVPIGSPQSSLEEQVVSALRGRSSRILLVLDNLEQLVEVGAALSLRTLLERVPTLTILATSRQSIGVEGEQEIAVDPLPVPIFAGSPDRLMEFPSIQLFVSRAQAARPDFPFNARNSDAIAALCTRLEGIPLAIELAAAWSQTLTPAQMLQRMGGDGQDFSFDLLASRRRDIAPRHATLYNAITWSHDLLSPEIQHFFATLSVFRGGWTLEAAEAVAQDQDAALRLAELQERSLLVSQEQEDGTMRYRLLEPLREFADDQLTEDARKIALQRHADYFLKLGQESEAALSTHEQTATVRRLSPETENFRAILSRSTDATEPVVDPITGLSLAAVIARFWEARGGVREGADYFLCLLALTENRQVEPAVEYQTVRAKVLRCTGGLLCALGEYEKAHLYQNQALELYQNLGDETEAARTYMNLGNTGYYRGDLQYARDSYERGLVTARQQKDESLTARILSNMAMIVHNQGDLEAALPLYQEGLATCRRIQDEPGIANALLNLGTLHVYREEFVQAQELFEECRSLSQTIGHRPLYVRSIHNLGVLARDQGNLDVGQSLLEESLRLCQEAEDKYGIGAVWEDLGLLSVEQGNLLEAASRYAQSLKMRQENGERISVAFTLQNIGLLAARQKKIETALYLLGAAEALCESLGSPLPPRQQTRQSVLIKELSKVLNEDEITKHWSTGRSLTMAEAVKLALDTSERN